MHDDGSGAGKNKLLSHAEGASHPTAGFTQSGGDGHFFNASAKIIDDTAAASHGGHASGKAMRVDQVRASFRSAIEQGFAPVAHVLPRAQKRERARLVLVAAGKIQLCAACALR